MRRAFVQRRLVVRGLCASVVLFAAACATMPGPHGVPLDPAQSERVLAALAAREERVSMIQGLFQVSITGALPVEQSITGVMSYQRPHSVRLKGLTRWGGTLFDFWQRGERFTLQLPGPHPRTLEGALDQLNDVEDFGRPIRLTLDALRPLVGSVTHGTNRILVYEEGDRYRLDIFDRIAEGSLVLHTRVWIEPRRYETLRMESLDEHGALVFTVRYDDYREVGSPSSETMRPRIRLPFRVQAEDLDRSILVTMTFMEIVATVV